MSTIQHSPRPEPDLSSAERADPQPPVAAAPPTALGRAILRTLIYADLFDYPLTCEEIAHYLMDCAATPAATARGAGRRCAPAGANRRPQTGSIFCAGGRRWSPSGGARGGLGPALAARGALHPAAAPLPFCAYARRHRRPGHGQCRGQPGYRPAGDQRAGAGLDLPPPADPGGARHPPARRRDLPQLHPGRRQPGARPAGSVHRARTGADAPAGRNAVYVEPCWRSTAGWAATCPTRAPWPDPAADAARPAALQRAGRGACWARACSIAGSAGNWGAWRRKLGARPGRRGRSGLHAQPVQGPHRPLSPHTSCAAMSSASPRWAADRPGHGQLRIVVAGAGFNPACCPCRITVAIG